MQIISLLAVAGSVHGTGYLHSPRGSNNRLREKTAIASNPNRLFQSNNNLRGGYNVGDKKAEPAESQADQYEMKYFQSGKVGGSFLHLEWMQTIGCGVDELGDRIQNCQIVIQQMCQAVDDEDDLNFENTYTIRNGYAYETQDYKYDPKDLPDPAGRCFIDTGHRDLPHHAHSRMPHYQHDSNVEFCRTTCANKGYKYAAVQYTDHCFCGNEYGKYGEAALEECNHVCRDKNNQNGANVKCGGGWRNNVYLAKPLESTTEGETLQDKNKRRKGENRKGRGLHESWEFYDACPAKEVLDRYGFECPHERQNYPVKYPTPWVDVAVFVDNEKDQCGVSVEHHNRRAMHQCVEKYENAPNGERRHKSQHDNEDDCKKAGGSWEAFYHYIGIEDEIEDEDSCKRANRSKINGFHYHWGRPLNYEDIAKDTLSAKACLVMPADVHCGQTPNTRPNYNGNVDGPSTEPYPEAPRHIWRIPRFPDSRERRCVLRLRTMVWVDEANLDSYELDDHEFGGDTVYLARPHEDARNMKVVFEDRSHVFRILPRPSEIDDTLVINNIVVRGKRGNIVQTYPAVEYDFVPNRLTIQPGEALQIQWTGSNTHDNNGHSDGQEGDDGQGKGGSDRSNFIQLADRKQNYAAPYEGHTLFHNATWIWSSHKKGADDNKSINLSLSHATAGYYQCVVGTNCDGHGVDRKPVVDDELDNANASYQGNVFVPAKGSYYYTGMRNNNFSNRSQKGEIHVGEPVKVSRKRRTTEEKPANCN